MSATEKGEKRGKGKAEGEKGKKSKSRERGGGERTGLYSRRGY